MNEIDFVTTKRKEELEKLLEKEIHDLKNNIICKEKFIFYIKDYSFMDFCYLLKTYIAPIKALEEKEKLLPLEEDKIWFESDYNDDYDDYHNVSRSTDNYKFQDIRRIKRVENMALKGKKIKKRKK